MSPKKNVSPNRSNADSKIKPETPLEAVNQNQSPVEEFPKEVKSQTPVKPSVKPGDLVRVGWKVKEGNRDRVSYFEGLVLGVKGFGISKTMLVRKIGSLGIGVERIFPLYSPLLASIQVKTSYKVRRAKLYYLRNRIGKAAMRP